MEKADLSALLDSSRELRHQLSREASTAPVGMGAHRAQFDVVACNHPFSGHRDKLLPITNTDEYR